MGDVERRAEWVGASRLVGAGVDGRRWGGSGSGGHPWWGSGSADGFYRCVSRGIRSLRVWHCSCAENQIGAPLRRSVRKTYAKCAKLVCSPACEHPSLSNRHSPIPPHSSARAGSSAPPARARGETLIPPAAHAQPLLPPHPARSLAPSLPRRLVFSRARGVPCIEYVDVVAASDL